MTVTIKLRSVTFELQEEHDFGWLRRAMPICEEQAHGHLVALERHFATPRACKVAVRGAVSDQ